MKLFSNLRQIAFRLDCSRTTATCSRNGLAIMWISHVSGCKYPRHSCLRRTRNRLNIANLVCFDPGFEYLGIRSMTDSQEETVNCYIHLFFVRFTHPFYQMCTFDTVFTDLKDMDGFRKDVENIHLMGFDGKSIINPRQIPIVHEIFTPTQKDIIFAEKVVKEIDSKKALGIGVFTVDGKMIDIAFYDGAKRTIDLAKASGVYKGDL